MVTSIKNENKKCGIKEEMVINGPPFGPNLHFCTTTWVEKKMEALRKVGMGKAEKRIKNIISNQWNNALELRESLGFYWQKSNWSRCSRNVHIHDLIVGVWDLSPSFVLWRLGQSTRAFISLWKVIFLYSLACLTTGSSHLTMAIRREACFPRGAIAYQIYTRK